MIAFGTPRCSWCSRAAKYRWRISARVWDYACSEHKHYARDYGREPQRITPPGAESREK